MLAIKSSSSNSNNPVTPNLLPCKIHHDGKLDVSQRHWDPKTEKDGQQSVFFRGRRLLGKKVPVPEGHVGAVLRITDIKLEKPKEEEEVEEDEGADETFAVEEISTFDSVMVWNHETLPEANEDPYVKGMEEWMGMAEAIHSSQ